MACQCPYSEQKHCFVFSDTAIMIAQETGCEDDWQEFIAFARQSDKSKFELEQALAELNATYKRIIAENLG